MDSADEPQGHPRREATEEPTLEAEALRRLEQRLDRASEAAERLIAEAAAAAVRRPPPAGWQQPDPGADASDHADADPSTSDRADADSDPGPGARARTGPGVRFGSTGELELLLAAIGALRDRIPPDLQRRLGEALREVLLAIRALIDWYLERSERQNSGPTEPRDIPIL